MVRAKAYGFATAILLIAAILPATASARVRPNPVGEIDCNGFSPIQTAVHRTAACADPRGSSGDRFYDNGHYIGHDEPSVRFISNTPGTGNNITFEERLGSDPTNLPTVRQPGNDITHWFELSVAPWFSLDVCDPHSAPMRPCTPNSDSNAPGPGNPGGGAGFVEMQFYPPGYAPFVDSISCDDTHWCAALTIDSLECNPNGTNCNNNCPEPVNFGFIQRDGVPAGPPSPQLSDLQTYTPNAETLLMDPGDLISVHMFDAALPRGGHALEANIRDVTTGQSGFMIASAANGFMNTNKGDCSGDPFNFEPEYSSAAANNVVPWGPGPYMIDTQFEIGHFEPCQSVTGAQQFTQDAFTDTFFTNCSGPYEVGAEHPGLEGNDSPCYRKGDTHGGTAAPNEVTGCDVFFGAIGDLDYDGTPYYPDWPTSTTPGRFPAAFEQAQPSSAGHRYEQIQFETDAASTEHGCNLTNGAGCILPPPGPGHFYPYWTLAHGSGLGCAWEFGDVQTGQTFGGDTQYGQITFNPPGAFTSPIQPNPTSCPSGASGGGT
jgi:hypothetical protein